MVFLEALDGEGGGDVEGGRRVVAGGLVANERIPKGLEGQQGVGLINIFFIQRLCANLFSFKCAVIR